MSEQLKLWPAERAGALLASPADAGLDEPFTYATGTGVWLVAKWSLCPKQGPTEGWWLPHWWEGPGTRTWRASSLALHVPHDPPGEAARFPSAQAAVDALAVKGQVPVRFKVTSARPAAAFAWPMKLAASAAWRPT